MAYWCVKTSCEKLGLMKAMRIKAEQTLPLRQSVLRPGLPLSDSRYPGDGPETAGHFGVFAEEALIAVGSIYPEVCPEGMGLKPQDFKNAWRLRGMATDPSYRSRGAGELVLKSCLEHARAMGADVVWCHARTGAKRFYERNGFVATSEEYDLPKIGPHFLMHWIPSA